MPKRKPTKPVEPLTDEGQADAPTDLGDRIEMTMVISVTREQFQEGGPDLLITLIRNASIAMRDQLGAEVRKRRWTFDF